MLALVALGSAALLLGLTYYIGPRLMEQSQALWTQLHQQVDHLRESYGDTPLGRTIVEDLSPPQAVQDHFVSYAGTLATSTLGGLTTAFILIVTSLYFAISPLAATRIRCTGCLGFRNILREDDNDAGTAPVGSHHYAHRLAGFDDDISHRVDPSMGDGLAHATCW
jgi:hypothetical protein